MFIILFVKLYIFLLLFLVLILFSVGKNVVDIVSLINVNNIFGIDIVIL